MKVLLKYSVIIGSVLISSSALAQTPMNSDRATTQAPAKEYVNADWRPALVPDGTIDRVKDRNYRTLEWYNIRENDIAFKRRFWKRIDVKERQNMPFIYRGDEYSGGGAFVEILLDGIKRGKIRAFADDQFNREYSYEDVSSKLSTDKQIEVVDPITQEITIKTIHNTFNPDNVAMYEIEEDYIFDRNAGRMVARLRSITPMLAMLDENTQEFLAWNPLFTIYYPEARKTLSQFEVYNPQNDVHRQSWSDYLDRMMYSGYIIKSSRNNPGGDQINSGLRGLYEGQKEMEMLIQKDMDMWEL